MYVNIGGSQAFTSLSIPVLPILYIPIFFVDVCWISFYKQNFL